MLSIDYIGYIALGVLSKMQKSVASHCKRTVHDVSNSRGILIIRFSFNIMNLNNISLYEYSRRRHALPSHIGKVSNIESCSRVYTYDSYDY